MQTPLRGAESNSSVAPMRLARYRMMRRPRPFFPWVDGVKPRPLSSHGSQSHRHAGRPLVGIGKFPMAQGPIRAGFIKPTHARVGSVSETQAVKPKRNFSSSTLMPSDAQMCFDASIPAAVLTMRSNSCFDRSSPSCLIARMSEAGEESTQADPCVNLPPVLHQNSPRTIAPRQLLAALRQGRGSGFAPWS